MDWPLPNFLNNTIHYCVMNDEVLEPDTAEAVSESNDNGGSDSPKPKKKKKAGTITDAIPDAKSAQTAGSDASLGRIRTSKLTITTKKPSAKTWFWIHPSPEYRGKYKLVETESDDSMDTRLYLIAPELHTDKRVLRDSVDVQIFTYCTNRDRVGLWPLKMRQSDWRDTALEGIEYAQEQLIRLVPDVGARCYDIEQAEDEPEMCDWDWVLEGRDFTKLLNMGFKNRYVTSKDHPLFEELWVKNKTVR